MAAPVQTTAQQNPAQQHSQQSQEADPISQFKELIPRLKASLVNVMRVSGKVFKEHSQADNLSYSSDESTERLDQHLEHFYSICDQIEMNLKLALECGQQHVENSKYVPMPVNSAVTKQEGPPGAPPPEHQSYHQYLTTVHAQITCAKEIHDAFMECSKKITERSRPLSLQLQQAQAQQAQQAQAQQQHVQQQAQQQHAQQQAAQMQQSQQLQQSQQQPGTPQQQFMQYQS